MVIFLVQESVQLFLAGVPLRKLHTSSPEAQIFMRLLYSTQGPYLCVGHKARCGRTAQALEVGSWELRCRFVIRGFIGRLNNVPVHIR